MTENQDQTNLFNRSSVKRPTKEFVDPVSKNVHLYELSHPVNTVSERTDNVTRPDEVITPGDEDPLDMIDHNAPLSPPPPASPPPSLSPKCSIEEFRSIKYPHITRDDDPVGSIDLPDGTDKTSATSGKTDVNVDQQVEKSNGKSKTKKKSSQASSAVSQKICLI